MIKKTTTKVRYRGIEIAVLSENLGRGTRYTCTNNSGKPKAVTEWFPTQGEAIANEQHEIDATLPRAT